MTADIRLAFGPRTKQNTRRVKAILVDLQTRFLITAAGGDTEGWSHHRWALVDRWVRPDLLAQADQMERHEARQRLIGRHVRNAIVTTAADIAWLFGWERAEVNEVLAALEAAGEVATATAPEPWGEVIVPLPWPGGRRAR
jgi:hypothetical protein